MHRRLILSGLLAAPMAALMPAVPARAADRVFRTSDGVRLHYTDSGNPAAPVLVFVPGWTMPAWIFQPQIEEFERQYRVIALDPRGQGRSQVPDTGYDHLRRGADIAELLDNLGNRQVVLVGWSLGVLDCLSYVQQRGDGRLAGLVLIDNSVGEEPPPPRRIRPPRRGPKLERGEQMRRFVRGMFRRPPRPQYIEALTQATLVTPPDAAAALLSYPVPRTYWRQALYSVRKPVLYVVTPRLAEQAANVRLHHPSAETSVFTDVGHALFVEDADRFNGLMEDWMRRRVWRGGL